MLSILMTLGKKKSLTTSWMVSVKEGIDKKVKQNHSHNLSRCIKIKSQIKDKIINSSLRVMRNPCLKECGVSNIVWIYFKEKNVDIYIFA